MPANLLILLCYNIIPIVFQSNKFFVDLATYYTTDIIGSDDGLAPDRHRAIIWTYDVLVYESLGLTAIYGSNIFCC